MVLSLMQSAALVGSDPWVHVKVVLARRLA